VARLIHAQHESSGKHVFDRSKRDGGTVPGSIVHCSSNALLAPFRCNEQ
jgi:hypothetical protein